MQNINSLLRVTLSLLLFVTMYANSSTNQEAEKYSVDYFSEFLPQTALDMVLRLPSFKFVEADDDIRGFAGGSGNVLIDGARPTTKSGGIREALSRIPASQVEHIELIRGSVTSSDGGGQSVLANVIKKDNASKRWELTAEVNEKGKISPIADLTIANNINGWSTSLNVTGMDQHYPRAATITSFDENKTLTRKQVEDRPSALTELFVSGDAKTEFDNQRLNINARLGWSRFATDTFRSDVELTEAELTGSRNENIRDSQFYAGELGIDWQVDLENQWSWRLINLNNNQNWFVDSNSASFAVNERFTNGSRLRFDQHKSEHILRSTLGESIDGDGRLTAQEYGVEATYTSLTSWLKTYSTDAEDTDETLNRRTFADINEKRTEVFAKHNWNFQWLQAETNFAYEYSKISVDGDSVNSQSLNFFKPSILLIKNHGESTQSRLNIKREIGQLNFSDFAASADLVNDREFSGNPELVPETKYVATYEIDYRYSERGGFALKLFHEWRKDVFEQVLLPSGHQAKGNAGDAKVFGIEVNLDVPLNQFIRNSILELDYKFIKSKFTDPLTKEKRELTYLSSPDARVEFRQDLVDYQLSWGLGYDAYTESEDFYIGEYGRFKTENKWDAFVEKVLSNGFKLRGSVVNLGDEKQYWYREIYDESRTSEPSAYEKTNRNRGPIFSFTVSRAF